jgi:hypothetical protein
MIRAISTAILTLVLTQIASLTGLADPLDTWILRHPLPTQVPLRSVAYGGGQYVAVGDGIIASADGVTWRLSKPGTTNSLASVAYGNGRFVAVGDGGTVLSSTDGLDWEPGISSTGGDFSAIAYGGGRFVAAAQQVNATTLQWEGTVLTSADGVNWVQRQARTSYTISSIGYGNGQFVAVGWDYSGPRDAILTSTDGVNWAESQSGPPPGTQFFPNAVAYGNEEFVAVGQPFSSDQAGSNILVSSNGIQWSQIKGSGDILQAVAYGGGRFVAADENGTILTSTDGLTWAPQRVGDGQGFAGVAYGANQFVAVGPLGSIFTSADGISWNQCQAATEHELSGIAYGNNGFITGGGLATYRPVGKNLILTSLDGAEWGEQEISARLPWSFAVAFGNGRFVVADHEEFTLSISSSTNGVDWVPSAWTIGPYTTDSGPGPTVDAIAYGNGEFVAVAESGDVLTSSDALSWTLQSTGLREPLRGVTYGQGEFVAVSDQGVIVTSPDGTNWTERLSGVVNLNSVAYGNGKFAAVGNAGTVLLSADGANWQRHSTGVPNDLLGTAFARGQFIAVGSAGTILTSSDGANWIRRPSGTPHDLYAAGFGNGHFVVVGQYGTILESGSIIDLALTRKPGTAGFELSVTGPAASSLEIETSTDLISWRNLTKVTLSDSAGTVEIPILDNARMGFYRASSPGSPAPSIWLLRWR